MGIARPQRARISPRPASRLVVAAVLLGALSVSGCGKKKHYITAPGPKPPPTYEQAWFPEAVLRNLALAYESRDSTEYRSLFDDGYQGSSIDMATPSPSILNFTKADEIVHISALSRSTTITSVQLQLRPVLVRSTDAGDPPGWALIQDPIFRLALYDASGSLEIDPGRESIEFHFVPTTPAPSSPTDTTWKIIRWTEVAF